MTIDLSLFNFILFFISVILIGEGIVYTLFPNYMKNMLNYILSFKPDSIRLIGIFFIFLGTLILYFVL